LCDWRSSNTKDTKETRRTPGVDFLSLFRMYYTVYGFLWLVSLLPLRVLYLISDAIYALVYYVIGYRRKVVMDNLAIAFPEKSGTERKQIAKRFYRNFIDTFIETIKLFTASKKFILER